MYNGQLSTLLLLNDVRVGDIIEYACTLSGENPVFNGKFVNSEYAGWSSPVHRQRLRVIVPAGRIINARSQGPAWPLIPARNERADGVTELNWDGHDLPVITRDADAPGWFVQYPYLELSEFRDWADVAAWARTLYEPTGPVPEDVHNKVNELVREAPTPEARTLAILDFVQREIRYLGIELGPNSHRPHSPGEVFAQRFGDCKDKVLLLCTMLRQLNITADPVLVSTYRRARLGDNLPSPYAFNHVIARVVLNHQTYFLDATQSYQRGSLTARSPVDASAGLPVTAEARDLLQWTGQPEARWQSEINEIYDFAGYDQPATVSVSYLYAGQAANNFRYYLTTHTPEVISRDFADARKRAHPRLVLKKPPVWQDNESLNTIRINFAYTIPDLWKRQGEAEIYQAEFYAWPMKNYTDQPEDLTRAAPLSLSHPVDCVVRTRVNFPDDWKLHDSNFGSTSPWFLFSTASHNQPRSLVRTYHWISAQDNVAVDVIPDYIAKLAEVRKHLGFNLTRNLRLARELEKFAVNWISVGVSAAVLAFWFWLGRKLLLQPGLTEPPLIGELPPPGLGGWLVLPAIGLVLRPLALLFNLRRVLNTYFDQRIWITYMSPESAAYHPATGGMIQFELAGNLSLIAFSLLAAILFFQCRRSLPTVIIAMLATTPLFLLSDHLLCDQFEIGTSGGVNSQTLQNIYQAAGAALLWIPYFLLSKRVKATFVR